jgi:hypothetical protein
LSIVRLTISATNPTDKTVPITRLEIVVPQGTKSTGSALTTDASLAVGTAGPTSPWALLSGGNGKWIAVPLPPADGVAAGQTITLVLSNIVVNEAPGTANITINEISDISRQKLLPVKKDQPSDKGHEIPNIISFAADPKEVAQGGETTLSWKIDSAISAVLQPGGIPISNVKEGQVTLPVDKTTPFTLQATGYGGMKASSVTVAVKPVQIEEFSAAPLTIQSGEAAVLKFRTAYAVSAAIDQGVGPVPKSGEVTVRPTQTTIYTLTALGRDPQTQAVTVTVQPKR